MREGKTTELPAASGKPSTHRLIRHREKSDIHNILKGPSTYWGV